MRHFFLAFFLSVGTICFLADEGLFAEPLPSDEFSSQSYTVARFPFSEPTQAEESFSEAAAVPVPPDTFAWDAASGDAEGDVPGTYGKPAPQPPSRLRPRYRAPDPESTFDPSDSKPSRQPIRQVSDIEAVPSESPSPAKETAKPGSFEPFEPLPTEPLFAMVPLSVPETVSFNNDHSCDEWSCGGGCSSRSGLRSFRHLGNRKPCRGLCGDCGLLTCSNKTRGPWYFDGWVSAGSFMNTHWPDNKNNSPLYYNDRNADVVMNQLYLSFGRRVDPKKGRWDLGGRVDLLYGTDYYYTGSLGLETRRTDYIVGDTTLDPLAAQSHWNSNSGRRRDGSAALYGLSMPQAYAELFIPWGHGVTLKAGHFYSDMTVESAMSPRNFFYSHSYGFMYGAPVTLSGGTATIKLGSRLSAVLGLTQGWNIWDNPEDRVNGLMGFLWESRDQKTSLSFLVQTGEESLRGSDNRTNYTLAFRRQFAPRWHYAAEHSFGYEKNGAWLDLASGARGPARWYSLAQYLQWEMSDTLAAGFRFEWFRDDGHSRIQKTALHSRFVNLSGKDYFELTLGLNWKPTRYITIRPEIRYDWANVRINDRTGVYDNKTRKEMVSFAIDGVFRF